MTDQRQKRPVVRSTPSQFSVPAVDAGITPEPPEPPCSRTGTGAPLAFSHAPSVSPPDIPPGSSGPFPPCVRRRGRRLPTFANPVEEGIFGLDRQLSWRVQISN